MGAGAERLIPRYAAAHDIQIQPTVLRHFDGRTHTLSAKRGHKNAALLNIENNCPRRRLMFRRDACSLRSRTGR